VPVLTYICVVSTGPKHLRSFFVELSSIWAYFARTNKIVAPYCWHTHSSLFRDSESARAWFLAEYAVLKVAMHLRSYAKVSLCKQIVRVILDAVHRHSLMGFYRDTQASVLRTSSASLLAIYHFWPCIHFQFLNIKGKRGSPLWCSRCIFVLGVIKHPK
jgi:hypothetical protein